MKVLVVGDGGREHALAWKIARDHPEHEILITRGNGGTADVARAVEVAPADVEGVAALVEAEDVAFTVIGPEAPLAAGLADRLRAAGRGTFGPGAGGARLEASKAFAKRLMADRGIPTARFATFTDRAAAGAYAADLGAPCVVKASGLAAGKGALVCPTMADVEKGLDRCLIERDFGAAGDEVVVEEFLDGEELSMIALTDGETLVPLLPSQDHKAALDGDRGPNTGGMGAYAPVSLVDEELRERIVAEVFRPALAALRAEGIAFSGCLYAGLMLTDDGPKVLEWNVRFGDPETQALLPLLETDLLALLAATDPAGRQALGAPALHAIEPAWKDGACVTVVAAARGYPEAYDEGSPIEIPADLADPSAFDETGIVLFHAGTRREEGRPVSSGGRVLDVTAVADDLAGARERAYAALDRLGAPGLRWRRDIGWRELERAAARR